METTQALREMVRRSPTSARAASISMGRAEKFVQSTIAHGHDVQCSTMARIARALGYGLALVPQESMPALIDLDAIPITGDGDATG